jgi:amino acid permease
MRIRDGGVVYCNSVMSTIMKTVNDNLLNLHFDINICISVVYVIISFFCWVKEIRP